jgi:hypothetical protein
MEIAPEVLDGVSSRTPALEHTVDLAHPIRPIDAGGHEALLLRVHSDGRALGCARTSGGGVVSPLQITDAIAQQLTAARCATPSTRFPCDVIAATPYDGTLRGSLLPRRAAASSDACGDETAGACTRRAAATTST